MNTNMYETETDAAGLDATDEEIDAETYGAAESWIDFYFNNHGSIIMVTPANAAAEEFIESNVEVEWWQWRGSSIALEPRCARDLADVIIEAGFRVQ